MPYTPLFYWGSIYRTAGRYRFIWETGPVLYSRVIAVILLLVAVMLTPTILNLIISEGTEISVLANLVFALVMLAVTFLAHRFLSGFWKSSLMLWSLIAGWLTFTALFGFQNEALTAIDWGWFIRDPRSFIYF